MTQAAHQLAFHGAIVLLFALLLGAPYAKAIKSNAPLEVVNSWRVAHQSLSLGAALMFALAAVLPILVKSQLVAWSVAVCFIASSYAFCVSTPLAAITRDRGLTAAGTGMARLVYIGNVVGAASSLIGAIILVLGAASAFF